MAFQDCSPHSVSSPSCIAYLGIALFRVTHHFSGKPGSIWTPYGPHVAATGVLRARIEVAPPVEEDYADDRKAEEAELEAIEAATKHGAPLTDAEQSMLKELRAWAQRNQNRADSKAEAVIEKRIAHSEGDR